MRDMSMKPRIAAWLPAALLTACFIGAPSHAHAHATGGPVALEMHMADQGPLGGLFGLVLGYDRGGFLAGGVGMGVGDYLGHAPPFGLFGRVRLLRVGPLALGLEASWTREHHEVFAMSGMPGTPYVAASARWTWQPAYRADVQAFAEILAGTWSFRLQAGLGRRLNDPTCDFEGSTQDYRTTTSLACSQAPAVYQWNQTPDRNLRPISLVLAHRFDFSEPTATSPTNPGYRSPETAYRLSLYSTMLPMLAGATMMATAINYDRQDSALMLLGGASFLLGVTFGPSVGYLYAGDYGRAWGYGLLRVLGVGMFAAGTLAYMEDNLCEYCNGSSGSSTLLVLGFAAALATVTSSIYDIARAPQAARRENERQGLTAIALVPTVATSDGGVTRGMALTGRF
jgi:hypothetical protein